MVRRLKNVLGNRAASPGSTSFRKRYNDVEFARTEMLQRLEKLGASAQTHLGYNRALTLLNQRFRKAKLAQRAAILSAAEWTIDLLETMTIFV